MEFTIQTVLVTLVVVAAAVYLLRQARRSWRAFARGGGGCGCGKSTAGRQVSRVTLTVQGQPRQR